MELNKPRLLLSTLIIVAMQLVVLALPQLSAHAAAAPTFSCPASASWITQPSPPEEVPLGKDADFCQFYQFSWQWFLQLTSPSASQAGLRNFQVAADYPILEGEVNGKQQNSCDKDSPPVFMFVRTTQSVNPHLPFVIPERIGQAGGGDTIYDQGQNVVFYDIRFSRSTCNVGAIQNQPNFPSGTTELKSAWRIIGEQDKTRYFWMQANVDGVPGNETLGLIGVHLVRATTLHPEFIWATFEHKDNVPDCTSPQTAPAAGWSFTSAQCGKLLADLYAGPYTADNPRKCIFNTAQPCDPTKSANCLKGAGTEICRLYPDATSPTDPKAAKNIAAINDLNEQLVGPSGFLTQLPVNNPMAVWKNYFIVGGLWESDTAKPSSDIGNQRGSLRLANTVMETTFQGGFAPSQPYSSNCFGCHNYEVNKSNTLPASGLSHIFDDITLGQCRAQDVAAGPIWNNNDAQVKCPKVCKNKNGWNGQWKTTVQGVMSVCGCCGGT